MSVAEAGVRSLLVEGASPRVISLINIAAAALALSILASERCDSAFKWSIGLILRHEKFLSLGADHLRDSEKPA